MGMRIFTTPIRNIIFNDYVVNLHTKAEDNIDAYFKTNHIKADIVINTTEDINKLIGHIDQDVVPPSK